NAGVDGAGAGDDAGTADGAGTGGAGGYAEAGTAGNANAAGTAGGADGSSKGDDAGRCATREIRIGTHQDDELLFMNPDLLESLHAGHCVRTVYLTAGDAGKGAAYAATRDLGMRSIYAEMAGLADRWVDSTATFGGKTVAVSTIEGADVSLVFLRLPDG